MHLLQEGSELKKLNWPERHIRRKQNLDNFRKQKEIFLYAKNNKSSYKQQEHNCRETSTIKINLTNPPCLEVKDRPQHSLPIQSITPHHWMSFSLHIKCNNFISQKLKTENKVPLTINNEKWQIGMVLNKNRAVCSEPQG